LIKNNLSIQFVKIISMKTRKVKFSENNKFEFSFETLSTDEMNEVRGGVEPPKSRDKDVFDID